MRDMRTDSKSSGEKDKNVSSHFGWDPWIPIELTCTPTEGVSMDTYRADMYTVHMYMEGHSTDTQLTLNCKFKSATKTLLCILCIL